MKSFYLTLVLSLSLTCNAEQFHLLSKQDRYKVPTAPKEVDQDSFVVLCVALTILAVGAVAVYAIYACAKRLDPPPKTNTNSNFSAQADLAPSSSGADTAIPITIESSQDLQNWQIVGVVTGHINDFVFYHTNSAPHNFYRAVIYP